MYVPMCLLEPVEDSAYNPLQRDLPYGAHAFDRTLPWLLYAADVLISSGQYTQAEAVLEQLLHSNAIDVYGPVGVQVC